MAKNMKVVQGRMPSSVGQLPLAGHSICALSPAASKYSTAGVLHLIVHENQRVRCSMLEVGPRNLHSQLAPQLGLMPDYPLCNVSILQDPRTTSSLKAKIISCSHLAGLSTWAALKPMFGRYSQPDGAEITCNQKCQAGKKPFYSTTRAWSSERLNSLGLTLGR